MSVAITPSDNTALTSPHPDAVLAAVQDFVYAFTPDGRFTYANRRLLELWGLAADDALGKTMRDLAYDPHVESTLMAGIRHVVTTGQVHASHTRYTSPSGAVGYYENVLAPVFGADGRVVSIAGSSRDVTERRRQTDALQRSAALLQAACGAAQLGIHEYDVATGTIQWDGRVRALWGVPGDLPISYEVFIGGIHPDDRMHVQAAVDRALDPSGSGTYAAEYRVISRTDGQERWVHATGHVTFVDGQATRLIGTVSDVTAHKQNERALRESEARFRAFQDTSTDGFMMLKSVRDAAGQVVDFEWLYANEAAERIVGRPSGWFLGRRLLEAMPGNRDEGLFDAYVDVLNRRTPWTREFRYARDGVNVYLRLVAAPIEDGLAVTFADLSERRQVEQTIAERERRFSTLANAMPQLVFTSYPNGDPEFLSDQWAAYMGRPLSELRSNDAEGWGLAMHPDDVGPTRARWAAALATGTPYEAEIRLRRHDGVFRWFLARSRPQFSPDGTIERWIGTCTDIDAAKATEQVLREQEAALRESEERFRILADGAPVLIWVNDLDGCEFVNQHYLEFTGRTMEEVTGARWVTLLHPDDRAEFITAYRAVLDTGAPFEAVGRLRRRDGEYRWTKTSGRARRGADGALQGYVGCTIDITEMRLAEHALREADQRKDRFLATLSHELRNPLAPIRTAAQLLGAARLSESQLHAARQIIQRQVAHMAWLLDDLLDIARITQGKLQLKIESVRLTAVIDSAAEAARPLLDRKQHRLTVRLPEHDPTLAVDPLRASQIVSNLLTNAAKYTDPNGDIELVATCRDAMLELRVSDDGIGIAADALPRLFTMFAQIEESASRSEGGLGIGLALVKGLVDLHGGSIDAASDGLGRGSTFTVRLPLARHVPAEHTQVGDVRAAGTARRRVLVVDDNHDAAASLGMLLELGGHDVRVAHGGRAALALAQTFRPDLALLDIGMPDMSGIDVARTLRREPWGGAIVLVALTGWGQDEDRRRTLEAGFVHHLTKPVDPEQIESLLRQGPTTGVRAASSV